ncbi:hypothetical protein SCP_0607810 [Sparassis crispa]|uniref:Uncharacterized protein n=1 Tax=Sparassis crispa TaxID=139825 RepID=A0A401GRC7_9APHY|nr:hypothetical protein SCP_0607810 [Sparassis crispa]GBE84801.1 hypothetical protein SCP_0607810 [Sparassis crispa]
MVNSRTDRADVVEVEAKVDRLTDKIKTSTPSQRNDAIPQIHSPADAGPAHYLRLDGSFYQVENYGRTHMTLDEKTVRTDSRINVNVEIPNTWREDRMSYIHEERDTGFTQIISSSGHSSNVHALTSLSMPLPCSHFALFVEQY